MVSGLCPLYSVCSSTAMLHFLSTINCIFQVVKHYGGEGWPVGCQNLVLLLITDVILILDGFPVVC